MEKSELVPPSYPNPTWDTFNVADSQMRELTINAVSTYPSLQEGTYLSSSWLLSQCSASTWSCHACCSPQPCLLPAWRACRAFLASSHPQLVSTGDCDVSHDNMLVSRKPHTPARPFPNGIYLQANSLGTVHASYLFICWERVSLDSPGRVQTFFAVQASLKFAFLFPRLQNVEVSRLCHLTWLLLNLFTFCSGVL